MIYVRHKLNSNNINNNYDFRNDNIVVNVITFDVRVRLNTNIVMDL